MVLDIILGAQVNLEIEGHSALNGAVLPEGATVAVASNDPAVATVDPIVIPAGGAQKLTAPVTILATGATDIHVTVTTPDGNVYEDTATLTVGEAPVPGLARIAVSLVEVPQT